MALHIGHLEIKAPPGKYQLVVDNRKTMVKEGSLFEIKNLLHGQHQLTLQNLQTNQLVNVFFPVMPDQKMVVEIPEIKGQDFAALQIFTSPPQVTVTLNDSLMGLTPLKLDSLSFGTYRLKLEKKGFQAIEHQVEISNGQQHNLFFVLFAAQ